jgi:fido (protein-threonine AMPylation protein)
VTDTDFITDISLNTNKPPLLTAQFGSASPLNPANAPQGPWAALITTTPHPTHPAHPPHPSAHRPTGSASNPDSETSEIRQEPIEDHIVCDKPESTGYTDVMRFKDLDVSTVLAQAEKLRANVGSFHDALHRLSRQQEVATSVSTFNGWLTGAGFCALTGLAAYGMLTRMSFKKGTLVYSLVGAFVQMAGCGVAAVRAENTLSDLRLEKTMTTAFLTSVESKLALVENAIANAGFYKSLVDESQYASGKYFATRCHLFSNLYRLTPTQRNDLESLKSHLGALRPLPLDLNTGLAVEIAALTVFTSNSIENAGLPLFETELLIKGLTCPEHTDPVRFVQTWTHARALAIVIEWVKKGLKRQDLRPHHLTALHSALMAEEPGALPGTYRQEIAMISSAPDQVLATPGEIESLVKDAFTYLTTTYDDEIEALVNFHQMLIRIHPFADGNGRVCRLVCTFLALAAGYAGFAITGSRDEYFAAIREWETDPARFGTFIVDQLTEMGKFYDAAYKRGEKRRASKERKAAFRAFFRSGME